LQSGDEGRLAMGLPRNPVLKGYVVPFGLADVVETFFVVIVTV
jgi:hypothetical protein